MKDVKNIQVIRKADMVSKKASSENFTGQVEVKMLFAADHEAKISSGIVTFEKTARTNWHTHSKGQMLYIISGVGQIQKWGEPIIEVKSGDIIWFPSGIKHWHGATQNNAMSHLALVPFAEENTTVWLEKVTDSQFNAN